MSVTCEPGVNYVVSEEGGAPCLSEKVQEYVDNHETSVKVIERQDLLQRLKDDCADMCPVKDGELVPTIQYRDLLFPIRVANFPRIGRIFVDMDFQDLDFSFDRVSQDKLCVVPEVDLLYVEVSCRKEEVDVWSEDVQVYRCQVTAKKNGKSFYAIKTRNTMHHLCHRDTFHSTAKKFKNIEAAMEFLTDGEMLEGVDLKTLKPGRFAPPDSEEWMVDVEVLKVWWRDEQPDMSDYERITDDEDESDKIS